MPEYVRMAHKAHFLIGQKTNIGIGEEDFDLEIGYIESEAVEVSALKTAVDLSLTDYLACSPPPSWTSSLLDYKYCLQARSKF